VPPGPTGQELPSVVEAGVQMAALPATAVAAEYHFTADDLEKVFIDAREWQKQYGPEPSTDDTGELPVEARVVVDESEPIEDITLEGERISIEAPPGFEDDLDSTDEFAVVDHVPDSAYPAEEGPGEALSPEAIRQELDRTQSLDYLLEPESDQAGAAPPTTAEPIAPKPVTAKPITAGAPLAGTLASQRWRRTTEVETRPEPIVDADREGSGWRTLAWTLASLVLALVLLAQIAHYYRQDLVRHPTLGPVLRDVYDRLGLPLSPNWDLAAFELRKWGNSDGPQDGRLSIRASLTNRAAFAQPHPILRLQLDDRFGASIAVRDFEPAEYLKNPSEASRLLTPSASTEAELVIVDPGQDAVGYRLDVCLRESPTLLRCAQGEG
jgi:hypothetical protein